MTCQIAQVAPKGPKFCKLVPFVWFLGVSRLSSNTKLSLLTRYNAKQAMVLDLAVLCTRLSVVSSFRPAGQFDDSITGTVALAALVAIAYSVLAILSTGTSADLGFVSKVSYRFVEADFKNEDRRRGDE